MDVLNLSLGFYHEDVDNPAFPSQLRSVLTDLRCLGVVVVASAGNDATSRPCYPAAFGIDAPAPGAAALLAVAADNPNGTPAMFSNAGDWVTTSVCGAAVVSTMPDFDAGLTPFARSAHGAGRARETVDPDDFLGGFGVWSGTSFAAPIVAGRIAAALTDALTVNAVVPHDVVTNSVAVVLSDLEKEHAALNAKAAARRERTLPT